MVRHLVVERRINDTVELIDVHGTDAVIKAFVFGLMAFDRLLVLAPLVGVAGVQRVPHPFQHLIVKVQPAQEFGELLLKHLLAHILAPARRWVALALISMTGAVIIDVAFLLDFANHRAAAGMTGDQPGEPTGSTSMVIPANTISPKIIANFCFQRRNIPDDKTEEAILFSDLWLHLVINYKNLRGEPGETSYYAKIHNSGQSQRPSEDIDAKFNYWK